MGQKVNPKGLRVGVIKNWDSRWYADKHYSDFLLEDYKIRQFLKRNYITPASRIWRLSGLPIVLKLAFSPPSRAL